MTKSKFQNIKSAYHEETCVVCLDDFTENSEVNITNEWMHMFHTSCLNTWYLNIPITKDLSWPHWKTVNTEKPKDSVKNLNDIEVVDISLELDTNNTPNSPNILLSRPNLNNTSGRLF